jgi:ATP-dependent helicase/nuclease subunit A
MKEFTPNQKKSHDFNRNLILSAGAGSGKTTVLISRIIYMLKTIDAFRLKQLVAITFTNKSADEMRARLREQLIEEREKGSFAPAKLSDAFADLNNAQITTIDSFLKRILERFSLELHIDPEFEIMSTSDRDKTLRSLAKRHFNTLFLKNDTDFLNLYTQIGERNLLSLLERSLDAPFATGKRAENSLLFWKEMEENYNASLDADIATDSELALLCQRALEIKSLGTESKAFLSLKDALADGTLKAKQLPLLDSALYTSGKLRKEYFGKKYSEEDQSTIFALSERAAPFIKRALPNWNENDTHYCKIYTRFEELRRQILEEFDALKREKAQFEFSDLLRLTSTLFQSHPQALRELRRDYTFFMIDEFQDTNFDQWNLLFPLLAAPNKPEILDRQRLFIVGDPKQAIYGFRGADVSVFAHVQALIEKSNIAHKNNRIPFRDPESNAVIKAESDEANGLLYLQENFRTEKHKLEFMNALFKPVFERDQNEFDVPFTPLLAGRKEYEENNEKQSYFLNASEDGNIQAEIDFIVHKILFEVQEKDRELSEIAILFRSRPMHSLLQIALKKHNIPFVSFLDSSLFLSQEAFDLYNLISFLSFPENEIALFGLLRSPFFSLENSELAELRKSGKPLLSEIRSNMPHIYTELEKLRKNSQILPAMSCLRKSIFSSELTKNLQESVADDYLASMDTLILTLSQELNEDRFNFFELESYLYEQIFGEESKIDQSQTNTKTNAVQLMTIHKSKGLEFDVVFLPFLDKASGSGYGLSLYTESGLGIFSSAFNQVENTKKAAKGFIESFFERRSKLRNFAEAKRIFYVAVTRAKKELYLSSSHKVKDDIIKVRKNSYAELIDETLGGLSSGVDQALIKYLQRFKHFPALKNDEEKLETKEQLFTKERLHSKGNAFSPTEIETFLTNQSNYIKKYLSGLFEEDVSYLYEGSEKTSLSGPIFGTIIHEVLQYADSFEEAKKLTDESLSRRQLKNKSNTEKVLSHIERFFSSEKTAFIREAKQSYHERSIQHSIGTEYLFGILDCIIFAEGYWQVIDYKSNAVRKDTMIKVAEEKYATQMQFYALLLLSTLDSQEKVMVRLYFSAIDEFYSREYTRDECEDFAASLSSTIEEIKALEAEVLS